MPGSLGKAIVIANARAGRGAAGKGGATFAGLLEGAGIDHEIRFTQGAGHATRLAAEALEQGHRYLIALGGDGTINEVVNGMMGTDGPVSPDAVLGVLPAGSGSDFIRTFGFPQDPKDCVRHLAGDGVFGRIDVGRIEFDTSEGPRSRYFANIAEAGLGGEVVRRAEGLPRSLGKARYMFGFWLSLGFFKPTTGRIVLDARTYEGNITNLVVANAQFFGGGMHIAPKAHPADGKFDVLIQKGNKRDYIAGITKVFKAEHLPSPVIKEYMSARVEVETERPMQVEADGEVLGFTKATFEVVPSAILLKS